MSFRSGGFRSGGGTAALAAGLGRYMRSGLYTPPFLCSADAAGAITQSTEYAAMFPVANTVTVDRIGLEVTTQAALNVVRLGIRQDNNLYPGTLLLDAGTIDASGTGFLEIIISQLLAPGIYWVTATLQGGTGAQIRFRSVNPYLGHSVNTTQNGGAFTQTGVTGALSTFSASATSGNIGPKILMRAA
jgi:hypothetical protein